MKTLNGYTHLETLLNSVTEILNGFGKKRKQLLDEKSKVKSRMLRAAIEQCINSFSELKDSYLQRIHVEINIMEHLETEENKQEVNKQAKLTKLRSLELELADIEPGLADNLRGLDSSMFKAEEGIFEFEKGMIEIRIATVHFLLDEFLLSLDKKIINPKKFQEVVSTIEDKGMSFLFGISKKDIQVLKNYFCNNFMKSRNVIADEQALYYETLMSNLKTMDALFNEKKEDKKIAS